jgi:predicted DNA-binding transcriptional regulator AlpA
MMTNQRQLDANQASLPAEGYVRLPQILAVIPISKSAWWAGVRSGRYPRSVRLGTRTTAWKVESIRQLIDRLGKEEVAA